jgi:hypothetical protein
MRVKPLTAATLPPEELAADCAAAVRVENSAVGQKAIYLPGRVFARNHGNFRQPLLVLCTGGQEQAFLYKREQTVRTLLDELQKRGVAVGKPKPPKPN